MILVNLPLEKHRYCYVNSDVDRHFRNLLDVNKPDVVHIGHLNHLSVSIVDEAVRRSIPVVYTLHDFWLMCPRGQFIQRAVVRADNGASLWPACSGQSDRKCATQCYSGYFSGCADNVAEVRFWTQWIHQRMQKIRETVARIDHYIAPSQHIAKRFVQDFRLSSNKVTYLNYGFDLSRFKHRHRKQSSKQPFTFGYIGRHIPAKGIHHLLLAFSRLKGDCRLSIWGAFYRCLYEWFEGFCRCVTWGGIVACSMVT